MVITNHQQITICNHNPLVGDLVKPHICGMICSHGIWGLAVIFFRIPKAGRLAGSNILVLAKHSGKSRNFETLSEMTWRQNPFVVMGPCQIELWHMESVAKRCPGLDGRSWHELTIQYLAAQVSFRPFKTPLFWKTQNIACLTFLKHLPSHLSSCQLSSVQGTTRDWDLSPPSRAERSGCLQVPPAIRGKQINRKRFLVEHVYANDILV